MDQGDLDYLHSGSLDLVRCVLDGADLSGLDLRNRDLQSARLEKTKFVGANLEGAKLLDANHANADFSGANLNGVAFNGAIFGINFSSANLTGANFSGLITRCNFSGANLCNANFQKIEIGESCNFADVTFDANTNFDGAKALRPYLRFDMLKGYELIRGVLTQGSNAQKTLLDENGAKAVSSLDEGIMLLSHMVPREDDVGLIGHNMPPPEFRLSLEERDLIIAEFYAAKATISKKSSDLTPLIVARNKAIEIAKATLVWIATKADMAVNEFAKSAGANLGSQTVLIVTTLHLTGALEKIVASLGLLIP